MNREIKFRAWNKKLNKFANDWTWNDVDGVLTPYHEDCVLMQFTGLHDKNGKEIYEGDIVHDVSDSDLTFEVKWDEERAGYYMPNDFDEEYTFSISHPTLEIIGNIYENPDFLK